MSSAAQESAPNVRRGVIKPFSRGSNYGFVNPLDGQPDVLLLCSTLRDVGLEVILARTTVDFESAENPKKPGHQMCTRIVQVVSVDEASPKKVEQEQPKARPVREQLTVKWYKKGRGYGFFLRPGTRDLFVPDWALKDGGLNNMSEGERYWVTIGPGKKGEEIALKVERG